MIKLVDLLSEEQIPVVVGIIDSGRGILSHFGTSTHRDKGFNYGIQWRYNPKTKLVYWKGFSQTHTDDDEMEVENHLYKKYKYEVIGHIQGTDTSDMAIKNIDQSHGLMEENMFPKDFNRHSLGSCMSAAEMATKYLLSKNKNDFKIIEGWVSLSPDLEDDESQWSSHTWIEFSNGRIFDPTKNQWRTWGYDPDGVNIMKIKRQYTPEEYLVVCEWEPSDWKRFKK